MTDKLATFDRELEQNREILAAKRDKYVDLVRKQACMDEEVNQTRRLNDLLKEKVGILRFISHRSGSGRYSVLGLVRCPSPRIRIYISWFGRHGRA